MFVLMISDLIIYHLVIKEVILSMMLIFNIWCFIYVYILPNQPTITGLDQYYK